MKMIIAIVQPFMAQDVVRVLHDIPGVTGATLTEARGFGRSARKVPPGRELVTDEAPKVRIEVVVRDVAAVEVAQAIRAAARTGKPGDGRVFVLPIDRAMRIADEDEGEHVV